MMREIAANAPSTSVTTTPIHRCLAAPFGRRKSLGSIMIYPLLISLSPPTTPHRSSATVAPINLLSIPCEYGLQNPPTPFPSSAGSFTSGVPGSDERKISESPSAISRPSRNVSPTDRMVASGCFSSQQDAASGELKKCALLQLTLRKLASSRAATMDTTADGGSTLSIPAGVTSMYTGSPVPRHGDSMLAGRPKSMGKSKASSAHQANRVWPSNSKRCGVSWRVKPRPTTLPCSSHSALGNRSSAARTSSGDLAEMAAISSGNAGLLLANKSSVGGMISMKALPPVALIGAVILAASSRRSLVFIGCFLSGTWILYGPAYREGWHRPSG